jgi:hypothetical protein
MVKNTYIFHIEVAIDIAPAGALVGVDGRLGDVAEIRFIYK